MTEAELIALLKAEFGFSKIRHKGQAQTEYWFARPVDADLTHYFCVEYHSNVDAYQTMFGFESKSVRKETLGLIDGLCTLAGAEPISHSRWAEWPCLTLFLSPEETVRRFPRTLSDAEYSARVITRLHQDHLLTVTNQSDVCLSLLKTDGAFDWQSSAPAYRFVSAAILVKNLGLDHAVFWKSVASLSDQFLSNHVVVARTGLSASVFREKVALALGLRVNGVRHHLKW